MRAGCKALMLWVPILGLAWPSDGSGEVVTFDFAGSVSSVYNPEGLVSDSLVRVGDPVQASLRFDTTTPDGYPTDPTWGLFVSPGWLKVNINGLRFEKTDQIQIDILNGANGDQQLFQAAAFRSPTTWPIELPRFDFPEIMLIFWENTHPFDFLANADLPTSLDFSRADRMLCFARAGTSDENMYEIQFNLEPVPEPGALALAGLAFGMWLLSRRKLRESAGKA